MPDGGIDKARGCLARHLIDAIRRDACRKDEVFAELLGELLTFHAAAIPGYERYVGKLSVVEPDDWTRVPPVPTDAFKALDLFAGAPDEIAHTFRTSGTSGAARGRAHFSREGLRVMDAAIVANAERRLFPDGKRMRILVLAPPPEAAPEMIMAHGMAHLIRKFGTRGSGFCIGPDGLDLDGLVEALAGSEQAHRAVCLIGASFGFVGLFDALRARGAMFRRPRGSRVMDAGGYKGRSRELAREAFTAELEGVLGVPPGYAVNLLGMTELASQFYDDALEHAGRRGAEALKAPPPWTRTVAIDPGTGDVLPDRAEGLLRHLDLANLDRPAIVQTDDRGWTDGGRFVVLGRAVDDGSRGCALTVEDLVGSAA